MSPESIVKITLLREGQRKEVDVTIGKLAPDSSEQDESDPIQSLGLTVGPLSDALRTKLGYDPDETGVLITYVEPGSSASVQGLRRGWLLAWRPPLFSLLKIQSSLKRAPAA